MSTISLSFLRAMRDSSRSSEALAFSSSGVYCGTTIGWGAGAAAGAGPGGGPKSSSGRAFFTGRVGTGAMGGGIFLCVGGGG